MGWNEVLDQIGSGRRQDDRPRFDYVDAPPYYLTAYGIAVKHGYTGTEEEWLASLKGEPGVNTQVTITEITNGYRVTFVDADHPSGQSFDVISPAVTVTEITGGHRITITDESHPYGQSFDVLDGEAAEAMYGRQPVIFRGSIDMPSSGWSATEPYTHTVTVQGCSVAGGDRIDLQPTAEQLAALAADGVFALVVENTGAADRLPPTSQVGNPVLRLYASGGKPSTAMTVQCTVTRTRIGTKFVRIVPGESAGADITIGTVFTYPVYSGGILYMVPVEVVDMSLHAFFNYFSNTTYCGLVTLGKSQQGGGDPYQGWYVKAAAEVKYENTVYQAGDTIISFEEGASTGGGVFLEVTA